MIRHIFSQGCHICTEPIRRYWFIMLGLTIPIFVSAMYAEFRLTELAQANADEVLILACEAKRESGWNYVQAMEDHAEMLETYMRIECGGNRLVSHLLSLLYPELDPQERLKPVLEDLKRPLTEQWKAEEQIAKAARDLQKFSGDLQASSDIPSRTIRPRSVSEELRTVIDEAVKSSSEAVVRYGKEPNMATAEYACRKNRTTVVLVFFGRSAYLDDVNKCVLRRVLTDFRQTIAYNEELKKTAESDRDRSLLAEYSDSEECRIKVIEALLENDLLKARKALTEGTKQAYKVDEQQG